MVNIVNGTMSIGIVIIWCFTIVGSRSSWMKLRLVSCASLLASIFLVLAAVIFSTFFDQLVIIYYFKLSKAILSKGFLIQRYKDSCFIWISIHYFYLDKMISFLSWCIKKLSKVCHKNVKLFITWEIDWFWLARIHKDHDFLSWWKLRIRKHLNIFEIIFRLSWKKTEDFLWLTTNPCMILPVKFSKSAWTDSVWQSSVLP